MKPRRAHFKKSVVVKNSRWAAYVTAGTATALTGIHSAEAEIHYSGRINQIFHYDGFTFQLDQPGDSFYLNHEPHYYSTSSIRGASAHFGINALAGASFAGFYNTCAYNPEVASISSLDRGEVLSARPFVPGARGILFTFDGFDCGGGNRGQFDEEIGFIGFKFNNGNGDQYGWARIKKGGFDLDLAYKLLDYAYGDVGDRIKAGQKSSNEMVPTEGSLGGLALGAAGLLSWRKSRSRATR